MKFRPRKEHEPRRRHPTVSTSRDDRKPALPSRAIYGSEWLLRWVHKVSGIRHVRPFALCHVAAQIRVSLSLFFGVYLNGLFVEINLSSRTCPIMPVSWQRHAACAKGFAKWSACFLGSMHKLSCDSGCVTKQCSHLPLGRAGSRSSRSFQEWRLPRPTSDRKS